MIYRIIWTEVAEDEISRLWHAAVEPDRDAIVSAVYEIRDTLQRQPESIGESRAGTRRVAFFGPLVVTYDLDMDRGIVWLIGVGRMRHFGSEGE